MTTKPAAVVPKPSTPQAAKSAPPRPAARPQDKRVVKLARAADAKPGARRTAAVKGKAAATAASGAATAAAGARNRKPVPGSEQQVDGDVALISAIISQSERHRGEREPAGTCSGAKCLPRPARP
ncbi:hypothetical protein [Massilia sp. Se16.2.3]|uniref:hypothetical protein n=1 Tax=Massilia sp. Se16.2.3 TaxID=2709303 RepID=UPI001600D118|nr:hypothetical protein [Massilia sp. Se16.2.3]QNA99651.1 hypothetical protein G4G31_13710 [Massilia sp. Se16.2.3]